MRIRFVPVIAAAALAGFAISATAPQQAVAQPAHSPTAVRAVQAVLPPEGDPSWTKVFEDGFNLPHVIGADPKVYRVGDVDVWRNVGSQPMSSCATVNTAATPGNGTITLNPRPNGGGSDWQCRITSTQQFTSGVYHFAARIKVHKSQGHLSSFWVTGGSGTQVNEIDVIENSGVKALETGCKGSATLATNTTKYYGLNHTFYSSYNPVSGRKHCLPQAAATSLIDDQFHTFHAEWAPGQYVKFYTDGALSATFGPQYAKSIPVNALLTNIGAQTTDPANAFVVDWVKVWKKNPPPVCAENECWRSQLGVSGYNYIPNSNGTDLRLARIIFDRQFYLNSYPDVLAWAQNKVATQGGNIYDHAEWHWLNYGVPWGRSGSATWDPILYMNHNPDIAAAYGWTNYGGAISHYISHGRFEGRRASTYFDTGYYKSRYGDMAGAANYAVVDHFTTNGLDEGRQGSAEFAPAWYMGFNVDLRNAFGSNNYRRGMSHWISNGFNEGRAGHP